MDVRFLTLYIHTTSPRVGQILDEHEAEMSIFGSNLDRNRNEGKCFSVFWNWVPRGAPQSNESTDADILFLTAIDIIRVHPTASSHNIWVWIWFSGPVSSELLTANRWRLNKANQAEYSPRPTHTYLSSNWRMNPYEAREVSKFVENWPKIASPKKTPILDLNSLSELGPSQTIIAQVLHSVGCHTSVAFFTQFLVSGKCCKSGDPWDFCPGLMYWVC